MEGTRPCGEAAVYAAKAPFCSCGAPRGWPLSTWPRLRPMTSVMGWKPDGGDASLRLRALHDSPPAPLRAGTPLLLFRFRFDCVEAGGEGFELRRLVKGRAKWWRFR